MKISFHTPLGGETVLYALEELKYFIQKYSNAMLATDGPVVPNMSQSHAHVSDRLPVQPEERRFELDTDTALPPHAYRIESTGCITHIIGGSESALLTGVYEALTIMGVFFDTGGDTAGDFNIDAICGVSRTITPFMRRRGIRQHINFPMDISSYTLSDAKEYIRRLARMRMNAITFHSYTGQWHGCSAKGVQAGHFFYGQEHKVPAGFENDVDNRDIFCIPEMEPIDHDSEKREEWAQYWLRELMRTAKQAGMHVNLSLELLPGEDDNTQLAMINEAIKAYPDIDALEIITPEGGGDSALGGSMKNVRQALDIYKRVEKPVQIGMYVMCKDTLRTLKDYLDGALPDGVIRSILPAHGALAVRDTVEYMEFSPKHWQSTLIYSWAEFDGNMYLLQNSAQGVEALIKTAAAAQPEGVLGMCLNHWRTAENALTISYAAEAMISKMPAPQFYKKYAADCGIEDSKRLAAALEALGALDIFMRDNLFNIGFCFLGCWLFPGLSWIRPWRDEDMQKAIAEYEHIGKELEACLTSAKHEKGRGILRLLINRALCSILQIKAVRPLTELSLFTDDQHPGTLTGKDKEKALQLCDTAKSYFNQYMDTHRQIMPDRGCQGTLVSYAATIGVYIDHIRACFVEGSPECTHIPGLFDLPPPPDALLK